MLISLKEIIQKYNLNIKGCIAVGAHWAEEHGIYIELDLKNIVYIEPCKEAYNIMLSKVVDYEFASSSQSAYNMDICDGVLLDNGVAILFYNVACGEEEGEFIMNVSNDNQGQSNSLLDPKLHLRQHPEVRFTETEIVKVRQLDSLGFRKENYNLLVMDVQGAEGLVLKGATETLKHIDCIYTEVNRAQTYEGNMEIDEMDEYLKSFGFSRVQTQWASDNLSWGDAIYIKKGYYSALDFARDNNIEI